MQHMPTTQAQWIKHIEHSCNEKHSEVVVPQDSMFIDDAIYLAQRLDVVLTMAEGNFIFNCSEQEIDALNLSTATDSPISTMGSKLGDEDFWFGVIETILAAGEEKNIVSILSFSYDTAIALARRLNVRLELVRESYVFIQQVGRPSFQQRDLH